MPKPSVFITLLLTLSVTGAGFGSPGARAQEKDASGSPTIPPDIWSDKAELWPQYVLPTLPEGGPVDDRLAHDKTTVTHVFAPTALVLPPGVVVYENVSFLGQRAHLGLTPTLALHAGVTFAPYALLGTLGSVDSRYSAWANVGGTWQAHKTRDHAVSVWGDVGYRSGQDVRAADEFGLGVGVMFDALVHDRVIVHTALVGHLAARASWVEQDASGCVSRDEFFFGGCVIEAGRSEWVPPGGHWVGASSGVSYFMSSLPMVLKAQVLTALRTGSVEDLDRLVRPEPAPQDWVRRYSERRVAVGIVEGGGPLSFALGAVYTVSQRFSVGLSVLYIGGAGGPDVLLDSWWPQSTFAIDF